MTHSVLCQEVLLIHSHDQPVGLPGEQVSGPNGVFDLLTPPLHGEFLVNSGTRWLHIPSKLFPWSVCVLARLCYTRELIHLENISQPRPTLNPNEHCQGHPLFSSTRVSQKKLSFTLQLPFYKGGQLLDQEVSLLGHLPVFHLRGRIHGDKLMSFLLSTGLTSISSSCVNTIAIFLSVA